MCLTIDLNKVIFDEEETIKPFIATKDILVWKIITTRNLSLYRSFKYKPNCGYPTIKFNIRYSYNNDIDYFKAYEGYHAYTSRRITRLRYAKYRDVLYKIVKFYIPKGAKYYLGEDGDIVSNTIKSGDLKRQ